VLGNVKQLTITFFTSADSATFAAGFSPQNLLLTQIQKLNFYVGNDHFTDGD